MADNNKEVDLSLDSYIKLLTDYRDKAEKVFSMGVPNPKVNYVVLALDYAIQVAQGKEQISEEDKQEVMKSAEELAESAIHFYSKFAQLREDINNKDAAEAETKAPEDEKKGGFNMQ